MDLKCGFVENRFLSSKHLFWCKASIPGKWREGKGSKSFEPLRDIEAESMKSDNNVFLLKSRIVFRFLSFEEKPSALSKTELISLFSLKIR